MRLDEDPVGLSIDGLSASLLPSISENSTEERERNQRRKLSYRKNVLHSPPITRYNFAQTTGPLAIKPKPKTAGQLCRKPPAFTRHMILARDEPGVDQ